MKSIIIFADNPYNKLAEKLSKLYSAGTVGIIYDNENDRHKLVEALHTYKNSAYCYTIKDLINTQIPEHIRAIVGVGSRKVVPLVQSQKKAEIVCFLAEDYVMDYLFIKPEFIIFDNNKINKRDERALALGYTNATSILTTILDYLALAQLKLGEPLAPLKELRSKLFTLLIDNKHQDNYTKSLVLTIEQAWQILTQYNISSLLATDILRIWSRCPYPALALEEAEYCKQEFFINYLILCIFNLFSKNQFAKPLIPKDINAIISLLHTLEIDYKLLDFSNTIKADYTDKFFLLQEPESEISQFILTTQDIKKLSFNIRALMGKEFFKSLSYYDCLCYTLIANEFRKTQGLLFELANSGFIDALMEKPGAELSKYKTISI